MLPLLLQGSFPKPDHLTHKEIPKDKFPYCGAPKCDNLYDSMHDEPCKSCYSACNHSKRRKPVAQKLDPKKWGQIILGRFCSNCNMSLYFYEDTKAGCKRCKTIIQ